MKSLDPGPSQLASATAVGRRYGRSREWGRRLLKSWWAEQQAGGPPRVLRRGRVYYTTLAVLYADAPRARDEALYRKVAELEKDLDRAFERIAALERKNGSRR